MMAIGNTQDSALTFLNSTVIFDSSFILLQGKKMFAAKQQRRSSEYDPFSNGLVSWGKVRLEFGSTSL